MNKFHLLKYIKYKAPPKININIKTIENKHILKNVKKNIDTNDPEYSKNFWENIELFNQKKYKT